MVIIYGLVFYLSGNSLVSSYFLKCPYVFTWKLMLFFLFLHLGEIMFINIIVLLVISKSQGDIFYLLSHHYPLHCCEVNYLHPDDFFMALLCSSAFSGSYLPTHHLAGRSKVLQCSFIPHLPGTLLPLHVHCWLTLLHPLLSPLCLHSSHPFCIMSISWKTVCPLKTASSIFC